MTRSEIFTLAHSIAKNTKANFSSYRLAFATALTIAYSQSKQVAIMINLPEQVIELAKKHTTVELTNDNAGFVLSLLGFNGKIYKTAIYLKNTKIELTESQIEYVNNAMTQHESNRKIEGLRAMGYSEEKIQAYLAK